MVVQRSSHWLKKQKHNPLSQKEKERKTQGTTGRSVSPLCLARSWRSFWELCTWKTRRWFVTEKMPSVRANHAWQNWWPSMMGLQCRWIREQQQMSSAWTSAELLRQCCWTFSSLHQRICQRCSIWSKGCSWETLEQPSST